MILCLVAIAIAAIIAVGVERNNAQGQNTTSTVTALFIESLISKPKNNVTKKVNIAIIKAKGTSKLANLSIKR
ncbi:hypothetical protein HMPREF3188_01268 [Tissierellia bacterium KA00581]|nr:hypothetical protein HMPREF3188_01268 [Tissierellia bacterium KA00581]